MGKESFLLYKSFYEPIKSLSLEAKGALLEAIYEYQISGAEPPGTSPAYMAFLFYKNQFRLDNMKYEETCSARKDNAKKRWDANHANASQRMQNHANDADNEKEKENDNDKENVNEKDNKKENDNVILQPPLSSFSFNQFWDLYNKKTGLTKCEAIWEELTDEDKLLIKERLPPYIKATESEITFRKDPYTWLNGKHWLDEHVPATGKKSAYDLIN